MTTKITNSFRLHSINQFIESITEESNTIYYAFAAKHTAYANGDSTIPDPLDSEGYTTDVYRDMVFGKKIGANDVIQVIPRHDWTSGTIYTEYDDEDASLFDKEFYTVVNASSTYHVYKCLYNNGNTASTIEPDFAAVDPEDEYYETSDGYIWKYMYSVNNSIISKFSTTTYFPVTSNTTVESNAVEGAIDIIKVTGAGNTYNNYIAGNNYFAADDLRLGGNTLLYDISGNSSAASSNDYYNGCYIYIKNGAAGEVGQYKKIVDYIANSTSKTIQLESAFTNAISIASVYEIYPGVVITGDGTQTINAEARAIVNAAGNTIQKIDILNRGQDYQSAEAFVYAYPDVGAANATLRVIKSPHFGHGSNSALELGATSIAVSVTFSNNESNTIVQSNDYRTIGILKDPLFSNVEIASSTQQGTFITNEIVYKISPIKLGADAVLDATSTTISSTTADFTNQFSANDFIYLSDGTNHMLGVVNTVVNSSHLTLTTNSAFSAAAADFYLPKTSSYGILSFSNTSTIRVANVSGFIETNDKMIGKNSGAYLVANTISRSGVNKNFETFINMYKYKGTITAGSFSQDETIYQDSASDANTKLHSVDTSGVEDVMYTTNKFGSFTVPGTLTGTTSEALMSVTEEYEPEIAFKSGRIIFMENVSPITRQSGQSETFKFIFEF